MKGFLQFCFAALLYLAVLLAMTWHSQLCDGLRAELAACKDDGCRISVLDGWPFHCRQPELEAAATDEAR